MTADESAPADRPLVSIVIPAYNEEANLPEVYRRVTAVVDPLDGFRFECLVIDNCSYGGTEQVVREFVGKEA